MTLPGRPMATMLKGLIVLLPLLVVGLLLFWLITSLESVLGHLVWRIIGDHYRPGMGIALGMALSYVVGVVLNAGFVQRIYDRWEQLLRRVPLVKTIYGGIQDLLSLLSQEKRNRFNRVVLVSLGDTGVRLYGFVTREDLNGIVSGAAADIIAVYLPMSYQIGGYLALVPRSSVEPVDMSIEDASRLILTAAVSVGSQPESASPAR